MLYLYDTDMKKRKGARFSVNLPAASTKRVEIALDWSKLAVQARNMRAIALVHCSPQYGQILLDRFTLLEKGDPPQQAARRFLLPNADGSVPQRGRRSTLTEILIPLAEQAFSPAGVGVLPCTGV